MSDNREALSDNTLEILNPNEESFPDVIELIRRLKVYVDTLPSDVPDNISAFYNDTGYLVADDIPGLLPSWIGPTKPTYTKSEVGLSKVENYGIATELDAKAGTSNTVYMTPLRTKQAITAQVPSWALSPTAPVTYTHPALHETSQIRGLYGSGHSVLEINQYIDFHNAGSSSDYDVRLTGSTGALTCSGTFSATAVYNAVWNDYAEVFEKYNIFEHIEPGDIVVWHECGVTKSSKYQDNRVIGVYSNTYGHLLGGDEGEDVEQAIKDGKYVPIGLAGRVNVKVTGDIEEGDLIILSDIPGVGCKCTDYKPGTVIGKALANHTGDQVSKIKILIQNI